MRYFMPNGPRGLAALWEDAPVAPHLVALNGQPCTALGLQLEAGLGSYTAGPDGSFTLAHTAFAPGAARGQVDRFEAVLAAGHQTRRVVFAVTGAGTVHHAGAAPIGRFGALTRAGEGGLDTRPLLCGPALDGAYGPFVVTGGVIQPSQAPLPLGLHGIGPYLVEVTASTQSIASTAEFADALKKPSARPAGEGGKSGLVLELREGIYAPIGTDLHGRFEWHPGAPVTIRSAEPARPAVFGRFSVGDPNPNGTAPPQGKAIFEEVSFFRPSRTRPQMVGTNWMNPYDHFNAWNLAPDRVVLVFANGAFVQDVTFRRCRFASDLPDLKTLPIPDLPFDEMGGIRVVDGRRVIVEDCLFEQLYNGISAAGEDCTYRGNTMRASHGDMIRPSAIVMTGGRMLPSRRLLIENNRWYGATGDNFRHPDGMHIFTVGKAGIQGMVVRGNLFVCDATTLAQPPKATGLLGTLLWQAPQSGAVALPAQNAAAWLIDDSRGAARVRLPSFDRLPSAPHIAGGYGAGATEIRLARSTRAWVRGDRFVHQGTTHTLVEPGRAPGSWRIAPALTAAGDGTITPPTDMGFGARLAVRAPAGATRLQVAFDYGRLEPGDSLRLGRALYRIDRVEGMRLQVTPALQEDLPFGTRLRFDQNWSVQRMGPEGQGITLETAPGEQVLVKDSGQGSELRAGPIPVRGAWGEYLVRPDFVAGHWLLNQSANTAYQTIFSGVDPTDGYQDVQFFANICISPGKGIEVGFQGRPNARNQAVGNICAYPWPGDLDGDGRANTGADGRQLDLPVAKLQLGGPMAEADGMRIAGNIAGTATYVTPEGPQDRSALNLTIGDRADKIASPALLAAIFQGGGGETFLPGIGEVVDAVRPVPGGPTEGQGLGMLGTMQDGDLWDFKTGQLRQTTPWEVLKLTVTPRVDGAQALWAEPAYRHREGLFGPEHQIEAYRVEASSDGGASWAGQNLDGGETGVTRLGGLAPGAQLRLRVRARNANGWGVWTEARPVTCPQVDPATSAVDAPLTLVPARPQGVAYALVVSVDFFGGPANGVRGLSVNGQAVGPMTARAEANRGLALFVVDPTLLGAGQVTLDPVFAGPRPSAWRIHASMVAGIAPGARPIASVLTGIGGTGGEVVTAGPETVLLAGVSQTGHSLSASGEIRVLSQDLPGHASRLAHVPLTPGAASRVRLEAGPVWTMLGVLRLKMAK
ncbi:MAG: fibronectin type III domain-containing protein [Pseudomonadota bacterium]